MRTVHLWGWLAAVAILGVATVATAQQGRPGGPGGFGFGGFGGFGGGGGLLALAGNEQIAKELELSDAQVEKLTALRDKIAADLRGQFQGGGNFRDLSDEERRARFDEIRKKAEEVRATAEKEMDAILLPHQRDRIRQISLQMSLRGGGAQGALSRPEIAEALSIDDAQKEKLREAAEAAQKELEEGTRKLREAARQKILDVLTPDQKAKWEKMIGEPFEFDFGRGQGGPGGRGPGGERRNRDGSI